jgi:bifunctional non-homologous end joining protein LigD
MAGTADVVTSVGGRVLTLTNLDKVIYPATGFTKAEVINYYLQIAPILLPHITDRVITRVRFPDGVGSASFYEKNAPLGRRSCGWRTSPPWSCTYRSGG